MSPQSSEKAFGSVNGYDHYTSIYGNVRDRDAAKTVQTSFHSLTPHEGEMVRCYNEFSPSKWTFQENFIPPKDEVGFRGWQVALFQYKKAGVKAVDLREIVRHNVVTEGTLDKLNWENFRNNDKDKYAGLGKDNFISKFLNETVHGGSTRKILEELSRRERLSFEVDDAYWEKASSVEYNDNTYVIV